MDILEKASLVGTNSVWGSVVSAKEIFSPESVNKFAKVERSLSIFINSIVLYSLVLSTPLRIGPSTWAKTLELNINVVTIVMIVKKLVFIVLILV
jgi:hypothetical protein